jgi:hypothetical protein
VLCTVRLLKIPGGSTVFRDPMSMHGSSRRHPFTVGVADGHSELDEQIRESVAFLKQHDTGLAALRLAPGVEDMR